MKTKRKPLATGMGDIRIQRKSIDGLRAAPYNPRTISDDALAGLSESLRRFGCVEPVIWNEQTGHIVGGHQRIKALAAAGVCEVDVVVVDLSEADEKTLNLTLNNPAIAGEFLEDALVSLLAEVKAEDPEGYEALLLAELAGEDEPQGNTDPDDIPAVPVDPVTRRGDVYELPRTSGEPHHRILCGDATKRQDVDLLLRGEKIDLCMTDPPYGADIQYASHDDTQDALVNLIAGFFPLVEERCTTIALTPGINNIWHYKHPDWILCWFYGAGTGRSRWGFTAWQPFLVWGACPKLAAGEGCHPDGFQFMMSKDDAIENRGLNHACPKPFSVWHRFMQRLTNKNTKTVYDPFMGSGTTLIAAEQCGHACYGMELDPLYCDVIVKRWEEFTGREAKLIRREG